MPHPLLAAVLALGGGGQGHGDDGQPIRLEIQRAPGHIVMRVVGSSPTAVEASYILTVEAGAAGGTNRSSQSGHVRLAPGQQRTLIDLSVGSPLGASWKATLHVSREGGYAYDIVRGS